MLESLSEAYQSPKIVEEYFLRHMRNRARRAVTRREIRVVSDMLNGLPAGARVLDAACGVSRIASSLKGKGWNFMSMDTSLSMLEKGKRESRVEPEHSILGSVFHLPLAMNSMDGCLCIRFLHHLKKKEYRTTVLKEFRRVVNGPIVVSIWTRFGLQSMRRRLKRLMGRRPSARYSIPFIEFYREASSVGLEVRRSRYLYCGISETMFALLTPVGKDSKNTE